MTELADELNDQHAELARQGIRADGAIIRNGVVVGYATRMDASRGPPLGSPAIPKKGEK